MTDPDSYYNTHPDKPAANQPHQAARVIRAERARWWRCYPLYWQSFAQGCRDLLRHPAQSVPFVLSLALMLALFLTVATLSRTLLLQPVPGIQQIEQLQLIEGEVYIGPALMNFHNKEMLPGLQQALAGAGEFSYLKFSQDTLKLAAQAYAVTTIEANATATANLGLPVILGQPPAEASNTQQVWLSEPLWQQYFASNPAIIGQTLQLGDETLIINGVLAHFAGHRSASYNQPLQLWRFYQLKDLGPVKMHIGSSLTNLLLYRHPQGHTIDNAAFEHWLKKDPTTAALLPFFNVVNVHPKFSQQPYQDWLRGDSGHLALLLLAVAVVLLVMTVLNLTNLAAGRFTSRERDMALQLVAGSTIRRLRWLLWLELLAWTLPALLGSVLLALWLLRLLPGLTGNLFPLVHQLQISGSDLFLLVIVVLLLTTALSWPLLPKSLHHQLQSVLAGSGKGNQQHKGLSKLVLLIQLGLSAVLVLSAASLTLSSYRSIYTDLGYRLSNAEFFNIEREQSLKEMTAEAQADSKDPEKAAARDNLRYLAWQELQQALQKKLPHHQVLLTSGLPIASTFVAQPVAYPNQDENSMVIATYAEPTYYQAFGMKLLHGRWLTAADQTAAKNLQPILVNEQLARQIAGDDLAAAIGQSLTYDKTSLQIVGILQDSKHAFSGPNMYKALQTGDAFSELGIALVSATDAPVDRGLVEQTLLQFPDFQQPIWSNLEESWSQNTKQQRLNFYLISLLAATSLLLAILGIAGIGRLHSHQRRFELAVRLATGARLKQLYWLVLAPLLPLLAVAAMLSWWISNQLMQRLSIWSTQLTALPLSWQFGFTFGLWIIAAVACWWPVRQALQGDPLQSLRSL
ncbi:MAG: ABC transporter permease [Gammaproteobacteria bacterium]|nr:ABC transporter permease [Gammaproteobacteria bacterium]